MGVDEIEAVLLHPPVVRTFSETEHAEGELGYLGDALGVDCTIHELSHDGWIRPYKTDGKANDDWYGWNEPLLAPLDSTVVTIRINDVTNDPGTMGSPPASAIIFEASGGTLVVYAHVQDVRVSTGDSVKAGDVVALIGNNGMCRDPHVHVGAWRGETPLQIRFDLAALGRLRREAYEAECDLPN